MADEKTIDAPGKPMSPSAIAAEIAYRKRKGLPPLSDEAIEAMKAGAPIPAESAAAPAPAAAAVAMSNIIGGLPPLPRKALNNSVIGAEQAYRKKKGWAPLSEPEIECLKQGLPMPWEPGGQMPTPAPAAAAPVAAAAAPARPATPAAAARPAAAAVPAGPAAMRGGVAN